MTRLSGKILLAAGIFPVDTPLAKRLEVLNKYLSPKPGQVVELESNQLREESRTAKDPGKLFGQILVSPPKGECFTVTTDLDRRDVEVCKPTWVKWRLEDLNVDKGEISWTIKSSSHDFGTPISWKVPYTVAKVMPPNSEFYKMNSLPVFFKNCVPTIGGKDGSLRKITLTKFDDSQWVIRFPDVDVPIPQATPEPTPPPEEPKKKDSGHGGDSHGEKKEESKEHEEGSKEAKNASEDASKKEGSGLFSAKKNVEEPEQWTINTGRGFEMNVGNLVTEGAMPPGKKGTCRYVYDYIPRDFSRGRIECHHTDQYLYVYAILPCMGPIIPANGSSTK